VSKTSNSSGCLLVSPCDSVFYVFLTPRSALCHSLSGPTTTPLGAPMSGPKTSDLSAFPCVVLRCVRLLSTPAKTGSFTHPRGPKISHKCLRLPFLLFLLVPVAHASICTSLARNEVSNLADCDPVAGMKLMGEARSCFQTLPGVREAPVHFHFAFFTTHELNERLYCVKAVLASQPLSSTKIVIWTTSEATRPYR
jgi:hypothetical protein